MRAPDEDEVSFFKLPDNGRVPVFEIFRVAFKENGDRLRLTITVCPTDRNRFAINVARCQSRLSLTPTRSDGTMIDMPSRCLPAR